MNLPIILPVDAVVNAACESTENYLHFLTTFHAGEEQNLAEKILLLNDEPVLIDSILWYNFSCLLHQHLNLRSDSSATLVLDSEPTIEIEIRIIDYDRRTGFCSFIAKRMIANALNGKIIIDFRWLVRRCLIWLQTNGILVQNINNIHTVPLLFVPSPDNVNSDEQISCINKILESNLSYIWGPPGTGKTNYVLATTVQFCVKNGEKVLVVAPTNLAVDNALSAIINCGIDLEKIARIGIPSEAFLNQYPECCEQRAFEQEIRQINSEIGLFEREITKVEEIKKLQDELEKNTTIVTTKAQRIANVEIDMDEYSSKKIQEETALERYKERIRVIQDKFIKKKQDPIILQYEELFKDIELLQKEHTKVISEIQELEKQYRSTGTIASLFAGKKRKLSAEIIEKKHHLCCVEDTLNSMRAKQNALESSFQRIKRYLEQFNKQKINYQNKITETENILHEISLKYGDTKIIFDTLQKDIDNLNSQITQMKSRLSMLGQNIFLNNIEKHIEDLKQKINLHRLKLEHFKQDLCSKQVIGMTLDGFIGFTLQNQIVVSRVFVDEAPYAPIVKVLPLLSLSCPIAMVGDHRQLPPVCECNNDATIKAYWSKPSIFLEDAFRCNLDFQTLCLVEEPTFNIINKGVLKVTYRFGNSLANILNRFIYDNMGLQGNAGNDTSMGCIACTPFERPGRLRRQNHSEVDEIMTALQLWWNWAKNQSPIPTIAILTPYKKQANLIRTELRERFTNTQLFEIVEVLNTNKSQGREWDCVFFSVSDTGNLNGNGPFLCDSNTVQGKAILNTTISRTKKHLRVFLDVSYWENRQPDSLLTSLVNM